MILLIGTGHVFDLKERIFDILDERQPDIVCVELDRQRYAAMMQRKQDPLSYEEARKNAPFIYRKLGEFQDNMAKQYGVQSGEEFIAAIEYAQNNSLPSAFIDMNAQQLFDEIRRTMTMKEKTKMIFSGIGGLFVSKKRIEEEVDTIQDNIDTYLDKIGEDYPTLKSILIDRRNQYMSRQLIQLHKTYQNIVCCVGDGHINGMSDIINGVDIPLETIRLSELRQQEPKEKDTSSAHFSIRYQDY